MPIDNCPISLAPPRVPVFTNDSRTYDFVSIANSLLREGPNALDDPETRQTINALTYSDTLIETLTPLSEEEKQLCFAQGKRLAETAIKLS